MKKNYFKIFIILMSIFFIVFIYIKIIHLKTVLNPNKNNNISVLKEINLGSTGYKAIAVVYNGGATTDFNTQIFIIKNSQSKIPNSPNIFIGNHSKQIDISWEKNRLIVYYNCCKEDIFLKKTKFNNIRIQYKPL